MNEKNTEPGDGAAPSSFDPPMCRRTFLMRLSLGLGALCAAAVTLPGIGFVLAPLFKKQTELWRSVGTLDDFKIGETVAVSFLDASPLEWAGVTARTAAWLRRLSEDNFVAFAVNCTHLGCPVRWKPASNLFMCPCHGGVYYNDGRVAAGPPPRPLTQYAVRIQDGTVQIQTHPVPIA
jgi:menaquinol-cytochrome c reductase iron-sulfur subunit